MGIFYLIYRIGECGVRRHWRLFVTITPLLRSMEATCHGQVCIVVLVVYQCLLHLLYVLAICMYVLWCLERTGVVNACCTGHLCWLYVVLGVHLVLSVLAALVVCVATCVCIVVLVAHLVLSVLAALGICVGYMWCLERTYMLALCIVGCLARTWCKREVALVKFHTFPISYGVTGHKMYFVRYVRFDLRQS